MTVFEFNLFTTRTITNACDIYLKGVPATIFLIPYFQAYEIFIPDIYISRDESLLEQHSSKERKKKKRKKGKERRKRRITEILLEYETPYVYTETNIVQAYTHTYVFT